MALRTALYDTHVELGGKIVDFAGFELPIQYANGIIHEHNVVRTAVGLFDVSHMGEILIWGDNATEAVQHLVTNKVATMAAGQCRYTLMCYENGGIVDDLLIYKIHDDAYLLVVNAANIDKDFDWMCKNLIRGAHAKNMSDSISQIAMQGPLSAAVAAKVTDISLLPTKNYYFTKEVDVDGIKCLVSTTGYTGEAGYEFYCSNADAPVLYKKLLAAGAEFGIEPIGLGARDTLRFEASMPLYGHELTKDTPAQEVGLNMFIKHDVDYIGKDAIENGEVRYERRGLKLVDRGIAREHCDVYDKDGEYIGQVSSGGPAPTLGGAYAMARLKVGITDDIVYIDVRGRRLAAQFTDMPFYKRK